MTPNVYIIIKYSILIYIIYLKGDIYYIGKSENIMNMY